MATIRMSMRIIESVEWRARKLFDNRIKEADEWPPNFAQRIYQAWLDSGHREIMDFIESKGVDLGTFYMYRDKVYGVTINDREMNLSLQFTQPVWVPYYCELTFYSEAGAKLVDEYDEWQNRRMGVRAEQSAYVRRVKQFLREQPTLNRALLLWPALKELLDERYLAGLGEPSRRIKRNATTSVDIGELNAGIVKAKFLEAR